MVAEAAVQPEGGRSTSADRGKQTAVGLVDSSEGYLKRIAELEEALRKAKVRGKRPETAQVPATKRRTQVDTAAAFVAAFPEPTKGEYLDARQFWQLKEHVAVVQQQCDDARSQLLALKLTREEEHHKHEAEVKDRKSTRLNSSHSGESRMPSSA